MHYDEAWEEAHAEEFKREREASQSRKKLLESLNADAMIKIMFKDYLHKLSDFKVIELKKEYIDSRNCEGEN